MHWINNEWVETGSHRFTSLNPATGQPIWEGWAAGENEIAAALKAAKAAFEAWSLRPYDERYAFCEAFKNHVEAHKDELAELIAQETGKVMWDSKSEVAAVLAKLNFAHESYQERTGIRSKTTPVGKAVVRHKPHGVMAVYGPYNFPAHLPNGHILPALLAGNVIIFKPSEQTPKVAEWLVKAWQAVGLPRGVLNLVQGERDTGMLLSKSNINGLLFTGSSATGRLLHAQFSGRPEILLALEMGGNNPLIMHDAADIRAAVHETLLSAFTGSGQRCTCARRLIVVDSANSGLFIKLLVESAAQLVVGSYQDSPEPFMGPLISVREANRLLEAQERLEKQGGNILLRMRNTKINMPFISPGIIDITESKQIADEEYFGPLLQLIRVSNKQEALKAANSTSFGLSASVFTEDAATYQWFNERLHAGLVNWNRQTTGASGAGPFGGVGISGNHRPAGYYSADYCAYPMASVENDRLALPDKLPPGMTISE